MYLLWPALKGGNSEESQHAVEHVVKVKVAVLPLSVGQHGVLQGVLHMLYELTSVKETGGHRPGFHPLFSNVPDEGAWTYLTCILPLSFWWGLCNCRTSPENE